MNREKGVTRKHQKTGSMIRTFFRRFLPMMGREDSPRPSLFYTSFNLDKRIRPNHPLRKIAKVLDFGFVSDEVKHLYRANGNVSVPPLVILRLLVLLMLYNVRSELEMMDTLPERLDWLWFLGCDLDSEIPHIAF